MAKLKNSKDLEIKLPEFRGYASDIDIYTFRSEFKKLVEPFLRKPVVGHIFEKQCVE